MGGPFRPPLSENHDFSVTRPPLDLRPVCKFKLLNSCLENFWKIRNFVKNLEFTDWSEVQRRFGSGEIAIFRQGGPKRPPHT